MTKSKVLEEIINYGKDYHLSAFESIGKYSFVQRRVYNRSGVGKVEDDGLDLYCLGLCKRYISRFYRK